jgi:chromosome segregation ATPase
VAAHPSPLATPVLDELQKRLTQARRAETKARQATDQARTAAAEARAAETMEREALDQLRRRHEEALTALAQPRAVLTEKIGGRLAIAADNLVEEQAQEAYRAAADAKAKHETGRAARDEAERAVRDLEQARAQAQTATTRHQERLNQFEERSSELGRQIAEIDEEIRKVTTAADPATERAVLHRRRTGIDAELRASREAEAQTASVLAAAAARRETDAEMLDQAHADAERQRTAASAAIVAAGFPDEAAVIAAALAPPLDGRVISENEPGVTGLIHATVRLHSAAPVRLRVRGPAISRKYRPQNCVPRLSMCSGWIA